MITWILMLINKVETANTVLAVLGIAWAIYLLLFFIIRANRTKGRIKAALISGAVLTLICDIIWFFKFFDNLDYLNPGVGGWLWLCIIFIGMLLLVMIESYINVNRFQHEESLRLKEAEKLRKKDSRKKKFEGKMEETHKEVPENTPHNDDDI